MILIERTNEQGYEEKEYETKEAISTLNMELENDRSLWIDGKLFSKNIILEEDILLCKKSICVTNKLIGG